MTDTTEEKPFDLKTDLTEKITKAENDLKVIQEQFAMTTGAIAAWRMVLETIKD